MRTYFIAATGITYKSIRKFIVSRILTLELSEIPINIEFDFNLKKYQESSFGVFSDEIFNVEIIFDQIASLSAKDYFFHESQKLIENKKWHHYFKI